MLDAIRLYARQFPNPADGPGDYPVCMGGGLEPERLLAAYSCGFFPWYNADEPIFWWSPDPRCLLLPSKFKLPSRSARILKKNPFRLSFDAAFSRVIEACAMPRAGQEGTWLNTDMISAYKCLHGLGFAHSVEAWADEDLVGGLYGIWLGKAFFGESMFHARPEASRAALAGLVNYLARNGCKFIDCQQATPHMLKMGAEAIPRDNFLKMLGDAIEPAVQSSAFRARRQSLVYMPEDDVWEARS